jgi:hypothetical protein
MWWTVAVRQSFRYPAKCGCRLPVPVGNPIRLARVANRVMLMPDGRCSHAAVDRPDQLNSRLRLEAEILVLRQQINVNVLRRRSPKRFVFGTFDRLVFVVLYRLAPTIVDALAIVRPDTVVRWHRAGFRSFWRWKSRRRGARPSAPLEIGRLIREMSLANPFWGARPSPANCLSSASMSARQVLQSTWLRGGEIVTGPEDLSFQSC